MWCLRVQSSRIKRLLLLRAKSHLADPYGRYQLPKKELIESERMWSKLVFFFFFRAGPKDPPEEKG